MVAGRCEEWQSAGGWWCGAWRGGVECRPGLERLWDEAGCWASLELRRRWGSAGEDVPTPCVTQSVTGTTGGVPSEIQN